MTEQRPILEMRGITKCFPGVKALDAVDFTLNCRKLTAVLGENGAGKSTLMRIIAGALQPDHGSYLYNGKEADFRTPKQALEAGIAMIYQELNLVQELSVAENIFLGREPLNRFGLVDYRKMNAAGKSLLQRLDVKIPPSAILNTLRVGQQQLVEIAKAISHEAKILIMDEPTSAISENEIQVLFTVIEELKKEGVAIAYITHKMAELEQVADDFVVMRDGNSVGKGALHDYNEQKLIHMMVGRDVESFFQKSSHLPREAPVLKVEGLSLKHPSREKNHLVNNVTFSVQRGEVLGVFGLMGAGRTEMLETIYGLHRSRSTKRISLEGRSVNIGNPKEAIEAGIVLVPEDRKADGLFLNMSVAENISLPVLNRVSHLHIIDHQLEIQHVTESLGHLRVKMASLGNAVGNLSGGNQQKAILCKWLAVNPMVILLDEPTRGIDIGAKKEIYALIDALAQSGLAVVMVSSELPEILAISDRVMVLSEGRKTAVFDRSELNEKAILEAALPKRFLEDSSHERYPEN